MFGYDVLDGPLMVFVIEKIDDFVSLLKYKGIDVPMVFYFYLSKY